MIANLGVVVLELDVKGIISFLNEAWREQLGYPVASSIGQPVTTFIVPDRVSSLVRLLQSQEVGPSEQCVELPFRHASRGTIWFEFSTRKMADRWLGTLICTDRLRTNNAELIRDVAQEQEAADRRRETEFQLQKAKEAAEEAYRTKSQFLANMSHELRTPMSAIIGYSEMLLDPRLDVDERVRAIQILLKSGRHLAALINDILDLSKIEAGQLNPERVPCRLWRTVVESLSVAGVGAREKELHLEFVPTGQLPRVVTTDPTRLRQILDNLLSNAVKFSTAGKRVEIRLRLEHDRPSSPRILLEVEDQGIGIPAEVIPRLFQPFTQADPSTTRRFGGTGLGLSICKRLAEYLGGSIAVRSTVGVGTCFTVTLPVAATDMTDLLDEEEFTRESQLVKSPETETTRLKGRVLLAEDTLVNQTILKYFLERAGLTVEIADNGRVAVEKAMATEFDVILMDMQMPELDGYAATSMLRQKGYSRSIVALTAHAMAGDEEKCLRAGCNAYLTKPIEADRLLKAVARQMPSRSWVVKLADTRRLRPTPDPSPLPVPPPPVVSQNINRSSLDTLKIAYRRSLPEKARGLSEALRTGDVPGLTSLAHRLRGSAGMYGLPQLSETASRLEEACRAGQTPAQLAEVFEELSTQCMKFAAEAG
jgi:signal transduction histidine kinase/DNA-binding NarL/FixJ family response regulator